MLRDFIFNKEGGVYRYNLYDVLRVEDSVKTLELSDSLWVYRCLDKYYSFKGQVPGIQWEDTALGNVDFLGSYKGVCPMYGYYPGQFQGSLKGFCDLKLLDLDILGTKIVANGSGVSGSIFFGEQWQGSPNAIEVLPESLPFKDDIYRGIFPESFVASTVNSQGHLDGLVSYTMLYGQKDLNSWDRIMNPSTMEAPYGLSKYALKNSNLDYLDKFVEYEPEGLYRLGIEAISPIEQTIIPLSNMSYKGIAHDALVEKVFYEETRSGSFGFDQLTALINFQSTGQTLIDLGFFVIGFVVFATGFWYLGFYVRNKVVGLDEAYWHPLFDHRALALKIKENTLIAYQDWLWITSNRFLVYVGDYHEFWLLFSKQLDISCSMLVI